MSETCVQVNLQPGWGGGEGFTVFFSQALLAAGVQTILAVNPVNTAWHDRLPDGCAMLPIRDIGDLAARLSPNRRCWLLFHTPVDEASAEPLRVAGHFLSCIAHMPLYGRDASYLLHFDLVFGVSHHVIASMRTAGVLRVYAEPLWGIANFSNSQSCSSITANSEYDWDRRKLRDRVLSWLYPLLAKSRPIRKYRREAGVTLGIVSRLTPIKQFPLLFDHIVPVLARHERFRLEIFGAGGFASVRDLRRALAPLGQRVRFWGHQQDVAKVYRQIDYLMTGLPEKEALGLNVLEAQACGTPVLAVNAPPFTETVADELTGLFYEDPRIDAGRAFERLLFRLETQPFCPDTDISASHLRQFSKEAFAARVSRMVGNMYELGVFGRQ